MVDRQLELLAGDDTAAAVDRCAEAGAVVVGEQRDVVLRRCLHGGPRRIGLHARSVDGEEDVGDPTQLLDEIGPDDDARLVGGRVECVAQVGRPYPEDDLARSGVDGHLRRER